MAKITVVSRTPYAWINQKREIVQATFVVYRDPEGRVGTVVVEKAAPSDADVEDAIKKRAAAR